MRVLILFLILFSVGICSAAELYPGVNYWFDPWCLTIEKGEIRLEHYDLRDYVTIRCGDSSVTILDFGCDGMIDIMMMDGKMVPRDSCQFIYFEQKFAQWKEEVSYQSLIEMWKKEIGKK